MINVLVVDDQNLVRTALAIMLEGQEGVCLVGQATCGEEGVQLARKLRPDVVLMDIKMPGIGGLEATKRLLRADSSIRVIALTVCTEEPFPSRLMQAGAAGYVTKGANLGEMLCAIRTVHSGQRYISTDVAQAMALRPSAKAGKSLLDRLSDRELQIMMLVVNGHRVTSVAQRLCLSPKTVNTYRYRIFDKLGVGNDVEMALFAVRHHLIDTAGDGPG